MPNKNLGVYAALGAASLLGLATQLIFGAIENEQEFSIPALSVEVGGDCECVFGDCPKPFWELDAVVAEKDAHVNRRVPAGCEHRGDDFQSRLELAVKAAAARSATWGSGPIKTEAYLWQRLKWSPMCYAPDITEEQLTEVMQAFGMQPPGYSAEFDTRFVTDEGSFTVWTGEAQLGATGRGMPTHLTYSFPADGTTWGLTVELYSPGPNTLNQALLDRFGSDIDRGREYLRQGLAAWRKYTGVTYTEVQDDNTAMTGSTARTNLRGDIRLGGLALGTSLGTLAYNAFPTTSGAANLGGSDMVLNTSYFYTTNPSGQPTFLGSAANDYRFLRDTVMHEHGHGLGYIHVVPCTGTKIMEPTISGGIVTLTVEERRGGGYNYGDRFAGNQGLSTAYDFGNLTTPTVRSVIERDLVLNRLNAPNGNDQDWFKFTLGSTQSMTIIADPTGGQYATDEQQSGCTGKSGTPVPTVNAEAAGDITLYLLNSSGVVMTQVNTGGAGTTETITQTLAAGTYYVSVRNLGYSNPLSTNANLTTQLYDLTVRCGSTPANPWAIAGIDKIVQAGKVCYFNGAAHSEATEIGATIGTVGYEWDLDGDGTFEVYGNTRPSRTYVSNGTYNVTLRVTDSNSKQDTDAIRVTVYGATSQITSILPMTVGRNTIVPLTISGKNLKGVQTFNIAFSGSGVSVSGTPIINAEGTQVTGLSLITSSTATLSTRNLTIYDTDGQGQSATLFSALTVQQTPPPSNDECNAPVSWGSTTGAKSFNNVNASTSANQSYSGTGCPSAGPIYNDVWYSWTAPTEGTATITNNTQSQGFGSRFAIYDPICPTEEYYLYDCQDFGDPISLFVFAGQQLLIRGGSTVSGVTGSATVTISLGGSATGACCVSTNCSITTYAGCAGAYQGDNTLCGTIDNPTTCCPANFDQINGVQVADIFAFLNAWFAQNGSSGSGLSADINKDNTVSVSDIFAFLNLWFAGC